MAAARQRSTRCQNLGKKNKNVKCDTCRDSQMQETDIKTPQVHVVALHAGEATASTKEIAFPCGMFTIGGLVDDSLTTCTVS